MEPSTKVCWQRVQHANGEVPWPRHGHKIVVMKDLLIVFGGGNHGIINVMHAFNTVTRQWFTPAARGEIPLGCAAGGFACDGTRVFLFGGMQHEGEYTNDMWVLMASRWEWKKLRHPKSSPKPQPRIGHSFVIHDSLGITFGGVINLSSDGDNVLPQYMNDLYTIDLSKVGFGYESCAWKQIDQDGQHIPLGRESHTAVVHQADPNNYNTARMIIHGGMNGARLSDVYSLTIEPFVWTEIKVTGHSIPRSLHTAVLCNKKMYVFGGWTPLHDDVDEWCCTSNLACLDIESNTWLDVTQIGNTHPAARAGHSAVCINDRMFIWSGRDGYKKTQSGAQICHGDMWYLETEIPGKAGKVSLVSAATDRLSVLSVCWPSIVNAEAYLLQIKQYDATKPCIYDLEEEKNKQILETRKVLAAQLARRKLMISNKNYHKILPPGKPGQLAPMVITVSDKATGGVSAPKKIRLPVAITGKNSLNSLINPQTVSVNPPAGSTIFKIAPSNIRPEAASTSTMLPVKIINKSGAALLTTATVTPHTSFQISNSTKTVSSIQKSLFTVSNTTTLPGGSIPIAKFATTSNLPVLYATKTSNTGGSTVQFNNHTYALPLNTRISTTPGQKGQAILIPATSIAGTLIPVQRPQTATTTPVPLKDRPVVGLKSGLANAPLQRQFTIIRPQSAPATPVTVSQRVNLVSDQLQKTNKPVIYIGSKDNAEQHTIPQTYLPTTVGTTPKQQEVTTLQSVNTSEQTVTTNQLTAQMITLATTQTQQSTTIPKTFVPFSPTQPASSKLGLPILKKINNEFVLETLKEPALPQTITETDDTASESIPSAEDSDKNKENTESTTPVKHKWCDVGVFTNVSAVISYYHQYDIDEESGEKRRRKVSLKSSCGYKIRVAGINSCGIGKWSDISAFRTVGMNLPTVPTAIKIIRRDRDILISWESLRNPGTGVLAYSLYLGMNSVSISGLNGNSQKKSIKNDKLVFIRLYYGHLASFAVINHTLNAAFRDHSNDYPAAIFRIAAINPYGIGPAVQVLYQLSQTGEVPKIAPTYTIIPKIMSKAEAETAAYHKANQDVLSNLMKINPETLNRNSTVNSSEKCPSVESSEKFPSVESTDKYPSVVYFQKCPRVEFSEKCPSVESSDKFPSVESTDKCPSVVYFQKCPRVEFSEKNPRVESSEKCPRVESSEKCPRVESSEKCPRVESSEKCPRVESSEKCPRVKYLRPSVEYMQYCPHVESSNTFPSVKSTEKCPSVESRKPAETNQESELMRKEEVKQVERPKRPRSLIGTPVEAPPNDVQMEDILEPELDDDPSHLTMVEEENESPESENLTSVKAEPLSYEQSSERVGVSLQPQELSGHTPFILQSDEDILI